MTSPDRQGPLRGLRVLCLAEQYPGPYATLLMSDMGAEVVVVERPDGGDPSRSLPAFHESLGRNKLSVALDLKDPRGIAALERMVASCDVLLEGFRPGTAERLGFGWKRLHSLNPRLVYVSISGFGQDGPYRDRPAHDLSFQAASGLLADVSPDQIGFNGGLAVGDLTAGMFAVIGALAALQSRERSGAGSYVDVSMMDCLISLMTSQLVPLLNSAEEAWLEAEPGYGLYPTKDGVLTLSISMEEHFWRSLCSVLDLPLAQSFNVATRRQNCAQLRTQIAARLSEQTTEHWTNALVAAGVPFAPVLTREQVIKDAHVQERGLMVEITQAGELRRYVRQPLKFDGVAFGPVTTVPALGEHTRRVLAGAGLTSEQIQDLFGGTEPSGETTAATAAAGGLM